jgi:DNA-binding MarR family transcriptional regulator
MRFSVEEVTIVRPTSAPKPQRGTSRPAGEPPTHDSISAFPPGSHLSDELVDTLDRAFRGLRKSMIRPPAGSVPVPALGRQLDMAKLFACEAVAELSETQASVSVKDVAALLDLEHSTVSRLLGEVEDDGLVVRGVDPADRRRTTISLTYLGRAVVADATAMSRFFTRILLADWDRHDVEQLTTLMSRLSRTVHDRLALLPELALQQFASEHVVPPPAPPTSPS